MWKKQHRFYLQVILFLNSAKNKKCFTDFFFLRANTTGEITQNWESTYCSFFSFEREDEIFTFFFFVLAIWYLILSVIIIIIHHLFICHHHHRYYYYRESNFRTYLQRIGRPYYPRRQKILGPDSNRIQE